MFARGFLTAAIQYQRDEQDEVCLSFFVTFFLLFFLSFIYVCMRAIWESLETGVIVRVHLVISLPLSSRDPPLYPPGRLRDEWGGPALIRGKWLLYVYPLGLLYDLLAIQYVRFISQRSNIARCHVQSSRELMLGRKSVGPFR